MPSVFKYNGNEIIDSSGKLGASTMDANQACVKTALNASGSAPIFACRAWVNFNGTGTVAIRDSGNVSSITDNGTGDYTVTFTTAMPDANYVANVTSGVNGATWGIVQLGTTYSSSQVQFKLFTPSAAVVDNSIVNVSISR